MTSRTDPLKALFYLLAAVLLFETVGVCAKSLSGNVTLYTIVFARSFFALVPLVAMLLWLRDQSLLCTPQPKLHLLRGVIGFGTLLANFYAISAMPLATVTAIQFTMPFFMLLLAALWLKEKLTPVRLGAVALGFAGALMIVNPAAGGTGLTPAVAAAFTSAILGGASGVIIRRLTATDHSLTIAFYFSLSAALFSLFLLPFGFVWPSSQDLLVLMAMGMAGGCAQLLLTQAYRYGQVSVIAPYEYSSLLWAISFGWLFFGDIPTAAMLAGAAVIVIADLIVLLHEEYRKNQA